MVTHPGTNPAEHGQESNLQPVDDDDDDDDDDGVCRAELLLLV